MKKAIVTVGVSGSGKTYWAERFCDENFYLNINRDDIRRSLFKFEYWSEYKFSRKNEDVVTIQQRYEIVSAVDDDSVAGVVISDTNLNKTHRENLIKYLENLGFDVEVKIFDIPLRHAIRNDLNRKYSVGRDVIYRQWVQFQEQFGVRPLVQNDDLPKAIIVDIDGTLATMKTRGPYEWDKVGEDEPNKFLIELLNRASRGYVILVVSGRDGCCYDITSDWLKHHGLNFDHLMMRSAGDKRSDHIVKMEIFDNNIKDVYNVVAVFDDRPKVITETWLPLGLKTYTLGDFNIDF